MITVAFVAGLFMGAMITLATITVGRHEAKRLDVLRHQEQVRERLRQHLD